MLEDASNQELLASWKEGNQQAAQVLVRRYMVRLTALARSRLSRKLARRIDAEDVVMSAWRSFFVAANIGRMTITDDDDPWPLLVTITLRKLARQAARHTADRRDAGLDISFDECMDWPVTVSRDPSPEEAAILIDEVESLMDRLDEVGREVLTRRLQGEEQVEIALAMNCSERTVRRYMQRIRTMIAGRGKDFAPEVNQRQPTHQQAVQEDLRQANAARSLQPDLQPTHSYNDITLKKLIGVGAFGKVYRSVFNTDGSTVAVKFLRKRFWKDRRARDQLLRETQLLSSLSHPNIIRHRGWGKSPLGALFVVMDWVDGGSSGEWFEHNQRSVPDIIRCGINIADALDTAHAAGLVHGDITPNNVLRRPDGAFVLTDFGFATFVGDNMSDMGAARLVFLLRNRFQICLAPLAFTQTFTDSAD